MDTAKIKLLLGKHEHQSTALLISCMLAIVCCVVLFMNAVPYDDIDSYVTEDLYMLSDWCAEGEKISAPIKLDVEPGSTVSLFTVLPESVAEDCVLAFYSEYQSVEVYVDNEIVYIWKAERGATPPLRNMVPITKEYAGKTVRIDLCTDYENYSGKIDRIYIGNRAKLQQRMMLAGLPSFIFCIVMFFLGMILFAITPFIPRRGRAITPFRYTGLYAAMMAAYLIMDIEVFPGNAWCAYLRLYLSPILFMLLPIPLSMYSRYRAEEASKHLLDITFWFSAVNLAVCLVLNLLRIVDLPESLVWTRILMLLFYGVLLYIHVDKLVRTKNRNFMFDLISAAALFITSVLEMAARLTLSITGNVSVMPDEFVIGGMVIFLVCVVFSLAKEIINISKERAELARQVEQDRYALMMSQMQPHFLFNTMVAIQEMCYTEPTQAADGIATFASYLRANLDSLKHDGNVPFLDEIRHIHNYIDIEHMRFADKLRYEEDFETIDFNVPPLTIQPIVENAVQHGIRGRSNGGTVTLSTKHDGERITIIIEDDGVGFKENEHERSMKIIRERLAYALKAETRVESEVNVGTRVTISFLKEKQ